MISSSIFEWNVSLAPISSIRRRRSDGPSAFPTLLKRASTSRCCFLSSLTGSMMRCLLSRRSSPLPRCTSRSGDAERNPWRRFAAPLAAQLHHRGPHERRRDCRSDRRSPPELAGFLVVLGDPSRANPYAGGVGDGPASLSLGRRTVLRRTRDAGGPHR